MTLAATRLDAANFRRSLLAEDRCVVPTGRRDGGPIRHPHRADRKRGPA